MVCAQIVICRIVLFFSFCAFGPVDCDRVGELENDDLRDCLWPSGFVINPFEYMIYCISLLERMLADWIQAISGPK